jgi:hypothetical protein
MSWRQVSVSNFHLFRRILTYKNQQRVDFIIIVPHDGIFLLLEDSYGFLPAASLLLAELDGVLSDLISQLQMRCSTHMAVLRDFRSCRLRDCGLHTYFSVMGLPFNIRLGNGLEGNRGVDGLLSECVN